MIPHQHLTFERENSPCFLTVMEVFSSARVNGLFSVFSNVSTGIHKISFSCDTRQLMVTENIAKRARLNGIMAEVKHSFTIRLLIIIDVLNVGDGKSFGPGVRVR